MAFNSQLHRSDKQRVAVIGAGLAGLTVAHRLNKQEIDVNVFEAKGRVGDRVLSAILSGAVVELGGHNIGDGGDAVNMRLNGKYLEKGSLIDQKELAKEIPYTGERLQEKLDYISMSSENMEDVIDGICEKYTPVNNYL